MIGRPVVPVRPGLLHHFTAGLQASMLSDVELEQLGLVDLCEPSRLQSSARVDVHEVDVHEALLSPLQP